jgi:hypothetical protein
MDMSGFQGTRQKRLPENVPGTKRFRRQGKPRAGFIPMASAETNQTDAASR